MRAASPVRAAPLLVVTCGNVMAGDDALGPLAAQELRRRNLSGVELAQLDLRPAALLDLLDRPFRAMIIVDAVTIPDRRAGDIVELDWRDPDRPPLANDDVLSSHGLSIASQIELAGRLGMLPPHVRLIGATISSSGVGAPAGAWLAAAVRAIVDRIAHRLGADHA